MNFLLLILQVLLALHTAAGGVWKFSNSVGTAVPSLAAIPQGLWVTLGVIEILAALAFVVPVFNKAWALLVPAAALFIVAEMLLFSAVHLASGHKFNGQVIYWVVVAVVGAFIAYGRLAVRPL
jgi:hypothetical protein